jgi:UPF0755 protein
MKRSRTVLRLIAFVALLMLGAAVAFFLYAFFSPNRFTGGGQRTFFVSKGQSFPSIVDSLEARGIIRDRALFVLVARLYGGAHRIQVGKYTFESEISNSDLYLVLRSGRGNSLIQVTVPEGYRSRSQARLFAKTIGIDTARFNGLVHDRGFIRSLGIQDTSLEGYLLPDTYGFYWQQDEAEIIRRMVEQLRKFYVDSLRAKQDEIGWTLKQVLTFASIVEGEAVLDEERAIIAGVYHNRLRRGIRLEADPTIQFIIRDGPRRLYFSDLKLDNPYNTYRYPGLPPGPVNNPGRASILATLFPVNHTYIFFVANGHGGHWFSSTYEEHVRRVRSYRRLRAMVS